MLKLENKYIADFYNENTFIDFEQANIFLVELFKNSIKTSKPVNNDIDDNAIISPLIVSNNPYSNFQVIGEEKIEMILNKLNPIKEVIKNMDESICGDFIIIDNKYSNIIIENKITKHNIKQNEIDYFINSCKKNKSNGIFMSQNTGIIGKNNFEIDIIGANVIIYVHCVDYDESKIQLAFELLYALCDKIKLLNIDNNQNIISKEILFEINKEHQLFVTQKEELQKYIKLNQIQMLNQVDSIKFSSLNSYLSSHFDNTEHKGIHKCNLCNYYTSNTLKGMAAHKRGCKKKHPSNT